MVLLFIGVPGSGKDTQADLLAKKYGYEVVSTGQALREEEASGSERGKMLAEITNSGKWPDDEIVYDSLHAFLSKQPVLENIIFTGAVRTVPQVKLMDETLAKLGKKLDKVMYFEIPDEEVYRRLAERKREDDTEEAIRSRIIETKKSISGILDAYEQQGKLVKVDGTGSIDDVYARIEAALQI